MTCSASQRPDIEPPMAVCAGAMIAELGRVATDDRIAPRSENLSSPMTRHRRRALRGHESEGFARPQLERAIALTCRMDSRTHRMSVRALREKVIRHISLTMREPPSNSAPLLRLVHAARSELCDPHLSRALVLVDGAMRRRRCSLRASPRGSPWTAASCRWISALSQRRRNAHESGRRCNCVLCGIGCRSIETACATLSGVYARL